VTRARLLIAVCACVPARLPPCYSCVCECRRRPRGNRRRDVRAQAAQAAPSGNALAAFPVRALQGCSIRHAIHTTYNIRHTIISRGFPHRMSPIRHTVSVVWRMVQPCCHAYSATRQERRRGRKETAPCAPRAVHASLYYPPHPHPHPHAHKHIHSFIHSVRLQIQPLGILEYGSCQC
jgi:hypothetical protein